MNYTSLDAWGQRENETPPVEPEKKQWIEIHSRLSGHLMTVILVSGTGLNC